MPLKHTYVRAHPDLKVEQTQCKSNIYGLLPNCTFTLNLLIIRWTAGGTIKTKLVTISEGLTETVTH